MNIFDLPAESNATADNTLFYTDDESMTPRAVMTKIASIVDSLCWDTNYLRDVGLTELLRGIYFENPKFISVKLYPVINQGKYPTKYEAKIYVTKSKYFGLKKETSMYTKIIHISEILKRDKEQPGVEDKSDEVMEFVDTVSTGLRYFSSDASQSTGSVNKDNT